MTLPPPPPEQNRSKAILEGRPREDKEQRHLGLRGRICATVTRGPTGTCTGDGKTPVQGRADAPPEAKTLQDLSVLDSDRGLRGAATERPQRPGRQSTAWLMADAYYSRKLRRHLLMSNDGELLFAHQHIVDVLQFAVHHGYTFLTTTDGALTLELRSVPPPERKEIPPWQNLEDHS